jgi:hypothetical protein
MIMSYEPVMSSPFLRAHRRFRFPLRHVDPFHEEPHGQRESAK